MQKSGPVFVAQDAAEAVFRWEDPPKTVFFAACWAFLCQLQPTCRLLLKERELTTWPWRTGWYPPLVLFIPNVVLASILLTTYNARKGDNPPPDSPQGPTTLSSAPPTEGSIDYLANLVRPHSPMYSGVRRKAHARGGFSRSRQQNIQIMMGRIADASDFGRSLVPYLTWHDERVSRALLHVSVVSSLFLALAAPYIPWRLVFFILGEGLFVLCHPVVVTFLGSILGSPRAQAIHKEKRQQLARFLEDDGLTDQELDMELVEIVRIEMESRTPDGGWEDEVVIGGELPVGARWLGDWQECIPEDGAVSAGESGPRSGLCKTSRD